MYDMKHKSTLYFQYLVCENIHNETSKQTNTKKERKKERKKAKRKKNLLPRKKNPMQNKKSQTPVEWTKHSNSRQLLHTMQYLSWFQIAFNNPH